MRPFDLERVKDAADVLATGVRRWDREDMVCQVKLLTGRGPNRWSVVCDLERDVAVILPREPEIVRVNDDVCERMPTKM